MKMNIKVFAICLLTIGLSSGQAMAEFVGIDRVDFQSKHYTRQIEPLWCWASSAAMVMSYQGVQIPQAEIVAHIKGVAVNQTAQPQEIVGAVNYVFEKNIDGTPSYVVMSGQYVMGAPMPVVLYNQLKQKKPIILTYLVPATPYSPAYGHAVVVTGIEAEFKNKTVLVSAIHVFDPYAYSQSPYGLVPDDNKIYQVYPLQVIKPNPYSPPVLTIPHGQITGVILMNSSIVQK